MTKCFLLRCCATKKQCEVRGAANKAIRLAAEKREAVRTVAKGAQCK